MVTDESIWYFPMIQDFGFTMVVLAVYSDGEYIVYSFGQQI